MHRIKLVDWNGTQQTVGISSAVEIALDGRDLESDQVTHLMNEMINVTRFVGHLTEMLVQKGVLDARDVCIALPGNAQIVDDV